MRPHSSPQKTSIFRRLSALACAAFAASALVGCPPPKPKTPPKPVAVPKPTPKPEPKCEKLTERCKAKRSTLLRIPKTDYAFHPPKGWTYAHGVEDVPAIAQASKTGAVIVADSVEMEKSTFKRNRQRDDLASFLFEQVDAKLMGKRPQHTGKVETEAGQKATLREYERSIRGETKGSALVVTVELEKRMLVVVVFAPAPGDDDNNNDTDIMSSIRGLRKVAKTGAKVTKEDPSTKKPAGKKSK